MWAIFSGDTPIFYGENLDDLQATLSTRLYIGTQGVG
jgi:hypothetical protein